jgi:putative sterol carrier protein
MAEEVTSPKQSFELIAQRITLETAKKLNSIYQFKIANEGDWSVDLTKEADWVAEGVNPNAKCTITVGGKEWVDILNGKLNPQMAFMSNKLKVQGDMGLAMKLQTLIQAVIGPPKKV